MICEKEKILFIHIPRCGGYGVETFFELKDHTKRHNTIHEYLSFDIGSLSYDKWDYAFAFVRNPYDRLVSLYEFFKRQPGWKNLATNGDSVNIVESVMWGPVTANPYNKTFDEWIEGLSKVDFKNLKKNNPQKLFQPMVNYVDDNVNILKFENKTVEMEGLLYGGILSEEKLIKYIVSGNKWESDTLFYLSGYMPVGYRSSQYNKWRIGCPIPAHIHANYLQNKKTLQRVNDIYVEDFEKFNYIIFE
jgi:hypothetical protein